MSRLNPISKIKISMRRSGAEAGGEEGAAAVVNRPSVSFHKKQGSPSVVVGGLDTAAFSSMLSPLVATSKERSSSSSLLHTVPPVEQLTALSLNRQMSRSSEEINLQNPIHVLEESAVQLAENFADNVEAVVLSPFAKLTRGIQNFGASLGPKKSTADDDGGDDDDEAVGRNATHVEADPIKEEMLKNTPSRTTFIL